MSIRSPTAVCRAAFVFVTALNLGTNASPALTEEQVEYEVEKSVALVVCQSPTNENRASFGTGFCVWSTMKQSYFLTNYHVVENAGFNGDKAKILVVPHNTYERKVLVGHMLRRTPFDRETLPDRDLAVIVIDEGNITPLIFTEDPPSKGTSVAIVGYPDIRLNFAKVGGSVDPSAVEPSAHWGRVNNVDFLGILDWWTTKTDQNNQVVLSNELDGWAFVEHDALGDNGNSGGPLFEANTGFVQGVVTLGAQGNSETEGSATPEGKAITKPVNQLAIGGAWFKSVPENEEEDFFLYVNVSYLNYFLSNDARIPCRIHRLGFFGWPSNGKPGNYVQWPSRDPVLRPLWPKLEHNPLNPTLRTLRIPERDFGPDWQPFNTRMNRDDK